MATPLSSPGAAGARRGWYWPAGLAVLLLLDLAFTFWRNYQLPLDGDLAPTVLPAPWYAQVLHDPFGWSALTRHELYSGPNRFFAHAAMSAYWKLGPRLLQRVLSPITSLYVASALFTTLTQAGLLFLLARLVQLATGAGRAQLWVIAALLVPFFQTARGFYEQMGITDRAVTYTFFYAFAMVLLLVLVLPFYRAALWQQPLHLPASQALLLVGLMVVVSFNGPVATATVAVLLVLVAGYWGWQQLRRRRGRAGASPGWLTGQTLGLLAILGVLSLYSFYIGRYNIENSHTHTVWQLYQLLPGGLAHYLLFQPGLPVLLLAALLNVLLVRRLAPSAGRQRLLRTLGWVGVFGMLYLLLLPLGGYRSYRPYLLRNDTALPVVLGAVFAYGYSTYFLLGQLGGRGRGAYVLGVLALSAFFLRADGLPDGSPTSDCERWSLDQLARAGEPVVEVAGFCPVLTWGLATDPQQSEIAGQMLYYWHVTPTVKTYYQKPPL
ncbi:hypothetical protein [Hymenobacter cheonanensis]|uniref:hypothetical protein n=1 Tax=Hymenobacter sp. CA2-7 TaxID=3063993 RepID=UPI00271396F8|nr:hypothetical protein [Hymenobacter sp. CA2-7]MDO7884701.1 hypothetical protein [Hymenobacter sp. CA2-7]